MLHKGHTGVVTCRANFAFLGNIYIGIIVQYQLATYLLKGLNTNAL